MKTAPTTSLDSLHEAAGGLPGGSDGDLPIRHYGDPAGEYAAATEGVALIDRSRRGAVKLTGRAPERMMAGVASGSIPPAVDEGRGQAPYSLVLTPKGRPISDLRMLRLEAGDAGALLLDVPQRGMTALLDHFKASMPPLFARPEDLSETMGCLTVVGPDAARLVAGLWPGRFGVEVLSELEEGDELVVGDPGLTGTSDEVMRIVANGDVAPVAFDLLGMRTTLAGHWRRGVDAGARPAGSAVYDTLRVEHGRPAFGVDVDESVLPPEAGLADRAIDHGKGCYTGQEVIVRIRDRGKVNRRLCGLLLGDAPAPAHGAPIFFRGRERAAGEVRSVVQSPRFGQGIALAYIRREVEAGQVVQVGAADGADTRVRELGDSGWLDPSPGQE